MAFLVGVLPYHDRKFFLMELFNELSLLAISFSMFCFTDFVADAPLRYVAGYYIMGTVALNLLCNMSILVASTLSSLALKLKVRKATRLRKASAPPL